MITLSTGTVQALTEIEALGLASQHDMANGHASQELAPIQQRIIESLPQIWMQAASLKSHDAELLFKDAFCKLAAAPSLMTYNNFKICPTASSSIDTVATWLADKGLKTALIEPTFDNLYLILKRRGVELLPLPEDALHTGQYKALFADADALFLVNPNNPTGKVLSQQQITDIAHWCAVNQKVLVLDNTFRFFAAQTYDMYQILLDCGVTFLSIEDTGKVWPTQEIKASLLVTSPDAIEKIRIIYDEIFLCHSNFALGILSQFLLDAHTRGLDEAVWKEVAARRQRFRQALDGTVLSVHEQSLQSTISVDWVTIGGHFADDLALAEYFKKQSLVVLPGRQFYWSKQGSGQPWAAPAAATATNKFVRFALLKPKSEFLAACEVIENQLRGLKA